MRDAPAGYLEISFPPARLIDQAAGEIVRCFADRLPNLSSVTILLPNLHAAADLKQALSRAAGCDVLLLPRLATLTSLAQTVSLGRSIAPPSLRLVQLYSALKERQWFDPADLWGISGELSQLFDDLTTAQSGLPASVDGLLALLEKSYRARPDVSMRFEARLAHEMWYAFQRAEAGDATGPLDASMAYPLQLAAIAESPPGPLVAIGLSDLAPVEAAFLRRYAERQPVLDIGAAVSAGDPLTGSLVTAWAGGTEGEPPETQIGQRAAAFRAAQPVSPLKGRLALYAAAGLEDEALAATGQVKRWLAEGKRRIALVAADRLTARRVRALLERDGVLLADESGWTLSTTSASTVIMRLLEVHGDGAYYRDVLDLCKSPFFAADWEVERRKRAVHRLEGWVREQNVVAGLDRFHAVATRQAPGGDEVEIIRRLDRAQGRFRGGRQTLSGWIDRLLEALGELGATTSLEADAAGRQLMEALRQRRGELSAHQERVTLAEWRRWLNAELEATTFRDEAIDSPVVLTTLGATRLRSFEAAVVLGADAQHLGGRPAAARLFNQAVRRDLGLSGSFQAARSIESDLVSLLACSDFSLITWQAGKAGERNAPSPWITRLEIFHALAWGEGLQQPTAAPTAIVEVTLDRRRGAPAPSLPPEQLPDKISASAYASLMACPYQFYARHGLRLNELEQVAEEMAKRDYGELVHQILARFHRHHPRTSALSESEAETALRHVTDEVFREHIENNYASLARKLRWEKRIPSYLAWQRAREAEGWRFHSAEEVLQRSISLEHGKTVTLHGRIDRIDRKADESGYAVLDYKTQNKRTLVDKLREPGEDVQLPVYALLLGEGVREAAFVSLDDEKGVAAVAVGEALPLLADAAGRRLAEILNGIAEGEPLPAQGVPDVCRYCEMRGLCRLDYWGDVT